MNGKHGAVWVIGVVLLLCRLWPLQWFAVILWVGGILFKCLVLQHQTMQYRSSTIIYILYMLHIVFPSGWITIIISLLLSSCHCQNCYLLTPLSAHCYSSHCPICSFNMTHTCHLGVVGDSHAADVVVGCRRHLSSTSCAVTGDSKKQRIYLSGFAWIYMNLQRIYWVEFEIRFYRLEVFVDFVSD